MTGDPILLPRYAKLAEQEARFWGNVRPRGDNPQLWDDPLLFDLFLRSQWEHLLQSVSIIGGAALEVGCGEGHLAIELAQRGVRVKGIDISDERIARANDQARKNILDTPDVRPEFEIADLNTIELPASTYDVVVAHDVLHHILRLDRLLGEIAKALKPDGRLIVYEYVGMGKMRKLLAALLYAILPTYQPYAMKLKLYARFRRFMKSEKGKREELNRAPVENFGESPFEEISQESIIPSIEKNFHIVERREALPFFFYLAPKVRCPKFLKPALWRMFRKLDDAMLSSKLARGAYVFVNAAKRI